MEHKFYTRFSKPRLKFLRQMLYGTTDGIQKLFTRFGKWSAKLDLKKVLVKPSPQLEFAFADGDG